MSWNRPNKQFDGARNKSRHAGLSRIIAVIVGMCLLSIVIVSFIASVSSSHYDDYVETAQESTSFKARSKNVSQCVNSNLNQQTSVAETNSLRNLYRDENGVLRHKGGLRVLEDSKKTASVDLSVDANGKPLYKKSIFKNPAEHEISRLLTMQPGQSMIGTRRYDDKFEAAFSRSLETPIVISPDDSPEDARLKQAMIEAKLEICDRIRSGEKLADILDETRSELKRLAQYKRDLTKIIGSEIATVASTDDEIQSYIDAANKMLEQKGIAPIKGGVLLRKSLILRTKENIK